MLQVPPVATAGDHALYYCLHLDQYFRSIGRPLPSGMLGHLGVLEANSRATGIEKYYALCAMSIREVRTLGGFARDDVEFVQAELLRILKNNCATYTDLVSIGDSNPHFTCELADAVFTRMCLDETFEQHVETAKRLLRGVSAGRRGAVPFERVLATYALANRELGLVRTTLVMIMYGHELATTYFRAQGRRGCSERRAAAYTLLFTGMVHPLRAE
jgi:hypothetical protein